MNYTFLRATFFLLTTVGLCSGAGVITVDLLLGTAGETITFDTSLKPTAEPFLAVTWSINGSNIITSTSADVIGEDYKNRIKLDKSTGTLQLTHLTERDSGEYELIIIPHGAGMIQGAAKLEVYFRVPKPTMACPTAKLIEDRNSIELMCNVDGSVSSRTWTKDGAPLVSGDRYKFHDGGRVLSISPVNRTDMGQFLCNVSNPISFETTLCSLTVYYGPDKPQISQWPVAVEEEEMVTLTCSADSFPKATFTWMFKNHKYYGPVYHLPQMEEHHMGRYTCTARNAVSGQDASEVHTLSDTSAPISGSMYVMVCSALTLVGLRLV